MTRRRVVPRKSVAGARDEMKAMESGLRSDMHGIKVEMQGIRGELATLKWMNGGLLAIAIAIFVRLLFG